MKEVKNLTQLLVFWEEKYLLDDFPTRPQGGIPSSLEETCAKIEHNFYFLKKVGVVG